MNKKTKIKFYFLTFTITIFLFLIIATISNHIPFGKYLFNYADSLNMYPALLHYTGQAIKSGNIFYNLHSALGTDFYNLMTLYMNSPFNLILCFLKFDQLFNFYNFLIFFRLGLASLTMSFYLNSIAKKKYKWPVILFSLAYTLSSYGICYCVQIMWMDTFWLLPLIIYGLDKLINEEKPTIYMLTLTITILINFYLGFMVCLFCLLYFIYRIILKQKYSLSLLKKFIISSLLSGLMCSVILIPQIISLVNGRGASFDSTKLLGISIFSFATLPISFLSGSFSYFDNLSNASPLIYCSVLCFVLNILYYFNHQFSKREKICTLVFTIFFILSLFVNLIDYTWNMFQAPNWWGHRYIFVFIFFLITIAYRNFENIKYIHIPKIPHLLILIIFLILAFASFLFKAKSFNVSIYYIVGFLLSIIFFALYFNIHSKIYKPLVAFCFIIEIIVNGYFILDENGLNKKSLANDYLSNNIYFEELNNLDNTFYRTLFPKGFPNDSTLFNFYSGELFASSYNSETKDFLSDKINYSIDYINVFQEGYSDPALLALFNFKYVVGLSNYYEKISDNIYLNNNVLPLGFITSSDFQEQTYQDKDYYNNINKMYSSLLNYSVNLYWQAAIEDYEGTDYLDDFGDLYYSLKYSFQAPIDGVIIPRNIKIYDLITITVNDQVVKTETPTYITSGDRNDEIIKVHKGDKVNISLTISEQEKEKNKFDVDINNPETIGVLLLDEETLNMVTSTIQQYPALTNIKTNNTVIDGEVTSNGGMLFISIPYNDSFTIKIDGEKTPYQRILGTFIGFNVPSGHHTISITYLPKGLKLGLIITMINILISIYYLLSTKSQQK